MVHCCPDRFRRRGATSGRVALERPYAVDREEDGVERGCGADKEAVALGTAEDEIGDGLGNEDLAEKGAIGVEDVNAVGGAHPAAALGVEAEAVEAAVGGFGPDVAAGKPAGFQIDIDSISSARLPLTVTPIERV